MKPIKFRAWDKILKKMANVEIIDFDSSQVKISYEVEVSIGCGLEIIKDRHPFTWYRKQEEVKLLQFVGLKDCNGKEIYDKDIVRIKYAGWIHYQTGIITWNKDLLQWSIFFKWVSHGQNEIYSLFPDIKEIEIIGNYYENPNLIEEERIFEFIKKVKNTKLELNHLENLFIFSNEYGSTTFKTMEEFEKWIQESEKED